MTHPILEEIAEWDRNRPRAQQVELGASQLHGCRAAAVLRLNRVEASDRRLRWDSLVGNSIHKVAEEAAPDVVLTEQRFTYRGVTATVDRYDPRTKTLTDVKTKENEAAIDKVRRFGPSEQNVAQVMLGAAALQEAGHEVEQVELLYLPRVGDPSSHYVWSAKPDRAIADRAVEWAEKVNATALDRAHLDPAEQADGLRDEPESFCRTYCEFATVCRGERPAVTVDDPLVVEAAQEYLDADAHEKAAKARKDAARRFLEPFPELPGLRWQGGNVKDVEEVDLERVLEDYRAVFGDPPTRLVQKVSVRQLRRAS